MGGCSSAHSRKRSKTSEVLASYNDEGGAIQLVDIKFILIIRFIMVYIYVCVFGLY